MHKGSICAWLQPAVLRSCWCMEAQPRQLPAEARRAVSHSSSNSSEHDDEISGEARAVATRTSSPEVAARRAMMGTMRSVARLNWAAVGGHGATGAASSGGWRSVDRPRAHASDLGLA